MTNEPDQDPEVSELESLRRRVAALEESERRLRDTVNNLDDGYYRVTMDGTILEHNQAFKRVMGIPEDLCQAGA